MYKEAIVYLFIERRIITYSAADKLASLTNKEKNMDIFAAMMAVRKDFKIDWKQCSDVIRFSLLGD